MRALVFVGAREMAIHERPDPTPERAEVIVAVRASGICGSDVHGFLGTTGRRRPGIVMGHEAAGDVVGIGPDVTSVQAGDRVVLKSILACGDCDSCRDGRPNLCVRRQGMGMHFDGAYSELVTVPQQLVVKLPDSLSYQEGALVEPLAVAMHAVKITPLSTTDNVVVVGAGPIGLLTLLAARRNGVGSVIVTDRSQHRLDVARQLGADLTVDVASTDPVAAVKTATGGRGADVVFEAVGIDATVAQSLAVAGAGAHVTWIGNSAPVVELPMQDVVTRELTIRGSYGFVDEFAEAVDALASRRIDVRPLIELVAPLDDGPVLFGQLADGHLDVVKVVLAPYG